MNVVFTPAFPATARRSSPLRDSSRCAMNMRSRIIIALSENILTGPSAAPRTTVPNFSG